MLSQITVISVVKTKLFVGSISLSLFLASWDLYINSYILQLNCVFFMNETVFKFQRTSQAVTIWFHNIEPLVIGLFSLYLVHYVVHNQKMQEE